MAKVQVREVRKLVLPIETALDAALELDYEQGGSLAFGAIVDARVETEPEPGLVVVVQRRGADSTDRRTFGLPIMAAAFIRYCWKCRIPLPRQGSKSIEVSPEGFIFTIEGTVEVVRRHGALPQRDVVRLPAAREETPEREPRRETDAEREPEAIASAG